LDADKPGSTCPLELLPLFRDPSPLFPEYKGLVQYKVGDFPVAEKFFNETIKVPIDIYQNKYYKNVLQDYAQTIKEVVKNHLINN
jgi:perosamine synthetase